MKRVALIRHAIPKSDGYAEDSLRPLSEEGKHVHQLVTKDLREKGVNPSRIYSSPLLRAMQTAEIMAEIYSIENVIPEVALGNDFDYNTLLALLQTMKENETIFLVGHAPTLAEFGDILVGKIVLPDGLSKSGIAVIEFQDEVELGRGSLIQVVSP